MMADAEKAHIGFLADSIADSREFRRLVESLGFVTGYTCFECHRDYYVTDEDRVGRPTTTPENCPWCATEQEAG